MVGSVRRACWRSLVRRRVGHGAATWMAWTVAVATMADGGTRTMIEQARRQWLGADRSIQDSEGEEKIEGWPYIYGKDL